ncbi:MAG: MFS transporter [Chloroflexi bacterium]|nr:MFS transporter [Chloroflexota bacterium]
MLGMLIASVSQTIVSPAMPRIVAELGGMGHYSWIPVSALLASTIVVPIVGKLSDSYGRKPFYVGGILLFLLGSIISGLAPNFLTLVAARVVQGMGMGTEMPLSQAIIGDLIAPLERGKYQGLMGAVGLSGDINPGAVFDPVVLRSLPPDVIEGIRAGLAAALHSTFVVGLPFVAIAFVAAHFIREIPLRRTVHALTAARARRSSGDWTRRERAG